MTKKLESGDRRLNFLANRFEKDIAKLVQNVIIISQTGKKVRISETMTKAQFKEIWEHLRVCQKETSKRTVMSQN